MAKGGDSFFSGSMKFLYVDRRNSAMEEKNNAKEKNPLYGAI
jgi:hypothetical protein